MPVPCLSGSYSGVPGHLVIVGSVQMLYTHPTWLSDGVPTATSIGREGDSGF